MGIKKPFDEYIKDITKGESIIRWTTNKIARHPLATCLLIYAVSISSYLLRFHSLEISNDPEQWGQMGDYFGGILNPIIGLLSIIIISKTLEEQVKSSQVQSFNDLFFSLINQYQLITDSLEVEYKGKTNKGRDRISLLFRAVKDNAIRNYAKKKTEEIPTSSEEEFHAAFKQISEINGHDLFHYFRTIYHLFKHVLDGEKNKIISKEEAKKYYDIIKSQLSRYEILILKLNIEYYQNSWRELTNSTNANPLEHLEEKRLDCEAWIEHEKGTKRIHQIEGSITKLKAKLKQEDSTEKVAIQKEIYTLYSELHSIKDKNHFI